MCTGCDHSCFIYFPKINNSVGAILLYKIPRVVIGENNTFMGAEELLRNHGVEVVVLNNQQCISMMQEFIAAEPTLWNEDIGVEDEKA